MPFPLRFLPPGPGRTWVDITLRTVDARCLLKPDEAFNAEAVGLLAMVTRKYPVGVGCVHIASNHMHLLACTPDVPTLSAFLRDLDSGLARLARRLHGGEGHVFARRPTILVVLDDDALAQRYRYYFDQATKDDLARRPRDWPGVHCVDALCRGVTMSGRRVDRSRLRSLSRTPSRSINEADCSEWHEVVLTPPPFLEGRSVEEQRAWFCGLEAGIEQETAVRQRREGITPPSAARLRAIDAFARPPAPKRSRAPRVLTTRRPLRDLFAAAYAAFVEVFHEAWRCMVRGTAFCFPEGGFIPGRPPVRRQALPQCGGPALE